MNSWRIIKKIKFILLAFFIFLFGCSSPLMEIIKEEVELVVMPPGVSTLFPEADSIGNSVTLDNILLTFTKKIDASSVNGSNFIVKDSEENIISGSFSVSNDTISFNPSSNLSYNMAYTITARAGILDVDGNQLGVEFSWSFQTADAPSGVKPIIKYIWINDNESATNSTSISLEVSATDYSGNIQNLKSHYRAEGASEWSEWLDMTDGILTVPAINIDVSEDGDIVSFEVEVKDSANIVSNPEEVDILYDISPPEVLSQNWLNAEFDLTQGILQIDFDGEMDLSSFSNLNFFIELDATPGALQGQLDLIESGGNYNSAVILQGVSLNPYTDYKITLGPDITDISGNPHGETTEWSFRTGKANDANAPEGPVILTNGYLGAYVTILPNGTLATDQNEIQLDLTGITDDFSNIVGMKFWGDSTPSYIFEPATWTAFPQSPNIFKNWTVSNTPGTKTVLYKFIDSSNQETQGALQVEVFLDNERPGNPTLTINEGAFTNNAQRTVSLSIDSSDAHTGIKEVYIYDDSNIPLGSENHTHNTGWIDWTPAYNEWILPDIDGTYTIQVTLQDFLNNQALTDGFATITLDRIAPVLTFTDNILIGTETQLTNPTHYTSTDTGGSGLKTYLWEKISGPGTIIFHKTPGAGDGTTESQPFVFATEEGDYYLQLTVTDFAGNSTSEPILFSWDTIAPGTISNLVATGTTGPKYYSTIGQPEWTWTGTADADYYRVSLDGFVSSENIGSSTSYTPNTALADGPQTLSVRAYDNAGNFSNTLTQLVTVDKTPPVISVINWDHLANVAAPTKLINFTGASSPDGSITDSGADQSGLASYFWSTSSGPDTLTFTPDNSDATNVSTTTDGDYQISLTATDNAGNTTTTYLSLLSDINAPSSPDIAGLVLTPNLSPTWNWTSGGNGNGNFEYKLTETDTSTIKKDWTPTTSLSYQHPSILIDTYTYKLEVREKDAAENWSAIASFNTELDTNYTTPAEIFINGGGPTLRANLTIQWDVLTGFGSYNAANKYRYYYDGSGTWIEVNTPLDPVTPTTFYRSGLSQGNHSITIQEYFNASWQTTKTATHTITVDTVPPSTPTLTGEGLTTLDSDRTAGKDVYPSWTWSSGGGGNGQFEYNLDGAGWVSTTGTSFTPYKTDGTYELEVKERDDAGNWSAISSHRITVDTIKPVITSVTLRDPTPYPLTSSRSHTNSTFVYVDIVGDISLESGRPVTIQYYDYNPSGWKDWSGGNFTGTSETISTTLSATNGTKTVYAKLVDEAGNYAYINDTIILDTVAPTGTFTINNGAETTPSLSFKMNLNITDNLTQVANLEVSTYDYYGTDGDGTGWETKRTYSALLDSDSQFSYTAGTKSARALIYDEAGNTLNILDSIVLQVPVPTYAKKGQYSGGYTYVFYNPVTNPAGGTYTTKYEISSTTDPNADPNNDPGSVIYENISTNTSNYYAYIPKAELRYFFIRARDDDTGGYGPYSSTNVLGFSSNVTVVYDKSDPTDALKAQYIKELLEDTYYNNAHGGALNDGILDQTNMAGSMPSYSVTLLDEDLINNVSYSTDNLIYGDPIIVTPGTAFSRLSTSYDIRARHIAASGKGIMGMGSNGASILDRIEVNWSTWTLTGTKPTQVGNGESAGLVANKSAKTQKASTSESIWHSPMQNTYLTANFTNSNVNLSNIFNSTTGDVSRNGIYLPDLPWPLSGPTSVTDGFIYAADNSNSQYYPVVRQGRFLYFGYMDIPGRGFSGSTIYQYGQVFFINLIARMDNY